MKTDLLCNFNNYMGLIEYLPLKLNICRTIFKYNLRKTKEKQILFNRSITKNHVYFQTISARRKDKGGMSGLMAGLMMMKGTLGALGFGALAMLAGKALMTGLMALMLSAIVGLKSLASGGDKKTTYEIVSKPVYTASHSHSSEEHHGGHYGGYGRSLDAAAETVHEALKKYGNVRDRRTVQAL